MTELFQFLSDNPDKRKFEVQLEDIYKKSGDTEKYLSAIIESALNGIAVTDDQGNFEFVNGSFLKAIEWPKEEIIGQNFLKIIPEDVHELAIKYCSEAQQEIKSEHEIKIKTKRGEIKYLRSVHSLMKIEGKQKFVSITEDITENVRLKQELKESNKHLKLVWYLMAETRGGKTRAQILQYLIDGPHNANQIAKSLNMDYKTIRHHLHVLIKNGIITRESNGYSSLYFISKNMALNFIQQNTFIKKSIYH